MKYTLITQSPTHSFPKTIEKVLDEIAGSNGWETVFVASAYTTISGMRKLTNIFEKHSLSVRTRWLFGLDDFVTQPGALDLCLARKGDILKICSFGSKGLRFHPKVILFSSGTHSVLLVGSSNLTAAGITKNAEAGVLLQAESRKDLKSVKEIAENIWKLGWVPSPSEKENYRLNYSKRKAQSLVGVKTNVEKSKKSIEVLSSDEAEIDPAISTQCWIEVGRNTALGRELEFKAEQALFFGLNPRGGKPEFRTFRLSNGKTVKLRLKYQINAMWRLQLNQEVPEVAKGLRPKIKGKLGRSPFVAIFSRTDEVGTFSMRFVNHSSNKFRSIYNQTLKHGTVGKTSSRKYGWL